jgi:hypothetical protein
MATSRAAAVRVVLAKCDLTIIDRPEREEISGKRKLVGTVEPQRCVRAADAKTTELGVKSNSTKNDELAT